MRIAIDLRSLHTGKISGVENYIINVLEHLLAADRENVYTLFYNGWRPVDFSPFHFVNSTIVRRQYPNKILNLSLKLFDQPKFEEFFADFDCLFLPNFNFFSIRPTTKLVVTVHDLSPVVMPETYNLKRRLWHWSLNISRILKRADCIIAVSEFTKQDIIRLYNIPEEKIRVVYHGINHEAFRPDLEFDTLREIRNIYGLPGEYLLFINTLEPRKNLIRLVQAYERLPGNTPLVVGGKLGWNYRAIVRELRRSKKHRLIKYLGYIPEEHKPYLIKLSRAVACPSIYEGFGLPALEAMSVGVPVVTSQVTSLPEVVGDAGLMVDPYNVTDIAKALHIALTDEPVRQTLIERGLQRAKQFDWQKTATGVLDALKTLQ